MPEKMNQRVLVVIPAYNEAQSIAAVLAALRSSVPSYDRVVVNDGSTDGTGEVVSRLGEKQLSLVHNLGYGHALQTGLKYALMQGYDIVVSMDADGQHQPEDVARLVAALIDTDAGLVIGSRFLGEKSYATPLSRRLGQLFFSHLSSVLLRQRIFDTSSGFKCMRADVCEAIVNGVFLDFHIESIVTLILSGYKIVEIPIVVRERKFGRSMHSIASVFQYPIKTILLTLVTLMDALLVRRPR